MKILLTVLSISCITFVFGQGTAVYSLQQCIDIAVENNLSVRRARLALENNKVNYHQSRASQLPDANVNWSLGYNWGRSIDPTTNQFISQRINSSGLNGNSSVVIFNGLQQHNATIQSKVNIAVSEADLEKAINDLSLSVANSYLTVLLNRELVENAIFQLNNSNSQLDRTTKLVESGTLPITNQLELRSQAASNEVALVNAQNNLDLSLLALKQSMLLPASAAIDVIAPPVSLLAESDLAIASGQVYEQAEKAQPEIKSADLSVKSAVLGVKIAQGAISPSLSLSGGFRTNYSDAFDQRFIPDGTFAVGQNPSRFVTEGGEAIFAVVPGGSFEPFGYSDQFEENLSWNLGFGVSIPLFNGLRTHSGIQRSKIQLQQAEIAAVEQRNMLRQQIESAYADARASSKTFAASTKQVEALEETFRSIENQYNLGSANFTDYQIANNNLFQAKSDLARAKYNFLFRKKILDFYQGKPLTLQE